MALGSMAEQLSSLTGREIPIKGPLDRLMEETQSGAEEMVSILEKGRNNLSLNSKRLFEFLYLQCT